MQLVYLLTAILVLQKSPPPKKKRFLRQGHIDTAQGASTADPRGIN